jgi:hypothetical protein
MIKSGIEIPKIRPKLLEFELRVNPLAVTVDEMKVYPYTLFPADKADFNPAFIVITAAGELAETVAPIIVEPLLIL